MIPHSRPTISPRDIDAVNRCLSSGMINEGAMTARLEAAFRIRFNAPTAVACGSGCQALLLALTALDVGEGDEVIMPSYVCAEVLATVEAIGAQGVIVDVDDDYLLSVEHAKRAWSPRCRAIVFPYLFGIWRDIRPLRELGLPIIEDCAQWVPSREHAGNFLSGDIAIFSFEATKLLTSGEGGLALPATEALGEKLVATKRFDGTPYKLNLYPLSDLLASLALAQLDSVDVFLDRRRAHAQQYFEGLSGIPELRLPEHLRDRTVFFRFPIRLEKGSGAFLDEVIERFSAEGVSVRKPVDSPLHRLRQPSCACEGADALFETTLSLPIYPSLTDAEARQVIDAAHRILGRAGT